MVQHAANGDDFGVVIVRDFAVCASLGGKTTVGPSIQQLQDGRSNFPTGNGAGEHTADNKAINDGTDVHADNTSTKGPSPRPDNVPRSTKLCIGLDDHLPL